LQRVIEKYSGGLKTIWLGFPMIPGLGGEHLELSNVNRSRLRAAAEEPSLVFNAWSGTSLPAVSIFALEAGHCAQHQGAKVFERFHFALFRAYFEDNRDIADRKVLLDVAKDSGLDVTRLASDLDTGRGRMEIEHKRDTLMARGNFAGVPTIFFGNGYPLEGAVPIQVYQRAVSRLNV
jgi:predicted DsbA family dithiol-disulfide isomerase